MIVFFRKNKRGIVGTLIIGMMIVLMLPFGIDYFGSNSSLSKAVVAKVGDDEISALTFDRSLYQFQSMLKKQFGDNYDKISSIINIKQKILDDLIHKKVLEDVMSKSNFEVGLSHVEGYIRSLPIFSGEVSRDKLIAFLKSQGLSERQFQQEVEDAIKFDQFEKILSVAASYSPTELEKRLTKSNQIIIVSFAKITSPKDSIDVKPEEIAAYYESHKENFKTEKNYTLHALTLPFTSFESKVSIHEEDYQDAYQRHKREFVVPQKARVEILSFQKEAPDFLKDNASPKVDFEQLAQTTREEILKDPSKFREIGQAKGAMYRQDESLKEVSHLPKEIQNKLNSLAQNEVSQVIETQSDFSLVKVLEYQAESIKPIDSVKTELESYIKKDIAPEFALVRADQIKSEMSSQEKTKIVEEMKKINSKEAFEFSTMQGTAMDLPPEVMDAIRSSMEGDFATIQGDESAKVIYIESIKSPEQKSLADVTVEIKKVLSEEKKKDEAKKLAKEILVSARNVGTFVTFQGFKELIKKYAIETSDIEGKLGEIKIPFLPPDKSTNKIVSEVVMNGTHTDPVEGLDGGVYVFVLKEISDGNVELTQDVKKAFLLEQEKITAQRLEKILTDNLKSKTTIIVNDEVLDKL